MVAAVVTADQCAHETGTESQLIGLAVFTDGVVQRRALTVGAGPQAAWRVIVENDTFIGGRPGIIRKQGDFGLPVQQQELPVSARTDTDQRGTRPRVDEAARRTAVQHDAGSGCRIDETGHTHAVGAGEDGCHLGAVPADEFGGALMLDGRVDRVDPTRRAIVGVGGDHPDLGARPAVRCHFTGQPVAVGRVHDPGHRAVDR